MSSSSSSNLSESGVPEIFPTGRNTRNSSGLRTGDRAAINNSVGLDSTIINNNISTEQETGDQSNTSRNNNFNNNELMQMFISALEHMKPVVSREEKFSQLTMNQAFASVPIFTGETTKAKGTVNVDDFMRSVDAAVIANGIPSALINPLVLTKFGGPAKEWYERLLLESQPGSPGHVDTWVKLKEQLNKRYSNEVGLFQLEREFHNLKQNNLSVSAFTDDFLRITSKLPEMKDQFLVPSYINRLKEDIGRLVKSNKENLLNLSSAIQAAMTLDTSGNNNKNSIKEMDSVTQQDCAKQKLV
ncbi:hypothetical protein HMI56_004898 [Coelomomyces lativittatus]|nr:hypothetical protein HMI56_004898 [Coelomomyces lativittatus]